MRRLQDLCLESATLTAVGTRMDEAGDRKDPFQSPGRDAGGGPGVVAGGRGGEVRSGGGIDLLIDGPDFAPRCPSSFG